MNLRFPDLHRRRFNWQRWLWTATAVVGLASAALFLFRDLRYALGVDSWFGGPDKGSLVVNINTATSEQLQSLPGIGPSMAARIIALRPYNSIDDLDRVSGIGPQQVDGLRGLVVVSGESVEIDR